MALKSFIVAIQSIFMLNIVEKIKNLVQFKSLKINIGKWLLISVKVIEYFLWEKRVKVAV